MPLISVIVPIYNVEKYLKECLDSIINQSLKDIEIILINDGSKDKSKEIIEKYKKNDNRIIAIHKENKGYGHSCNLGLKTAKGEYIAIVEPDDFIDSKMYEDLYNIAKQNDSDIVKSCFFENFDARNYKTIKKPNWTFRENIGNKTFKIDSAYEFFFYHPSIWSAIYKKDFLDKNKIKFIEAPGAGWTDNPFQVQTLCLAQKINYTPKAYYYWRKLNIDESKDLKDTTIPFKRSLEIHTWLKENGFKDEKLFQNLIKRELVYIDLILGATKISKIKKGYQEFNKMLSLMNLKNAKNDNYSLTNREKTYFEKISKNKDIFFLDIFLKHKTAKIRQIFREISLLLKLKSTRKKTLLWGASIFLEQFLNKHKIKNKNILGIVDNSKEKQGEDFCNFKCFSPNEIISLNPDEIIITILKFQKESYLEISNFLNKTTHRKIKLSKVIQ